MISTYVSSIGLVLDIVGALLTWYCVAEISYASKSAYLKGAARLELTDPTPDDIRRYKRRVFGSRIGVVLILLGFVAQLISNYV